MTQDPKSGGASGWEATWGRQSLVLLTFALLIGLRAAGTYLSSPSPAHSRSPSRPPAEFLSRPVPIAPQESARIPRPRAEKKAPPRNPLDLNRATREELTSLPGIGPTLAERIIQYRKENGGFDEVSEIKEVRGIGEKRYERIKDWLRVRGKGT